jgi:hypothetical protein
LRCHLKAKEGTVQSDIHGLIYVSHSKTDAREETAVDTIRDILTTSRLKNARLGVTGALLFSESCFIQVLEGQKNAVESVFEAIECDVRHRDVTLLSFREMPHRRFSKWSMAYSGASIGPAWLTEIEEHLAKPSAIEGDRLGQQLLGFMIECIRQQEIDRPPLPKPGE